MTKSEREKGDYPRVPAVPQLTLAEVRQLKPEAVERARLAGALAEVMKNPKWRPKEDA